jgi:hypothetical protein
MNDYNYWVLFLFLLPAGLCWGQQEADLKDKKYDLRATAELGFLGVFSHKIQFGQNTTYFDYRKQGGQNTLFANARFSLELGFSKGKKNIITLLYQPINIQTQIVTREDILIDETLFPMNTSLKTEYGFPFYRASYMRRFDFKGDRFSLAFGAAIQIRNATIKFESGDGTLLQITRDVGIVPLLKLRATYQQSKNLWLEFEIDGMYAPISYLNGSDNEVVGAIADMSLRQYFQVLEPAKAFLSVRYIGGGAVGTSDDTDEVSDGYTRNWLHFFAVTAGFTYEF